MEMIQRHQGEQSWTISESVQLWIDNGFLWKQRGVLFKVSFDRYKLPFSWPSNVLFSAWHALRFRNSKFLWRHLEVASQNGAVMAKWPSRRGFFCERGWVLDNTKVEDVFPHSFSMKLSEEGKTLLLEGIKDEWIFLMMTCWFQHHLGHRWTGLRSAFGAPLQQESL